jgi:hypothetical protein
MLTEAMPIKLFVRISLERREIKSIIEEWRVEHDVLIQCIVNHFNEVGIFEVRPHLEQVIRLRIAGFIKSSPEILKRKIEAERRERILARTKKSYAD